MIVVGIVMMMTTETGNVAALANTNLSQAFRYGIYSNDDIEEVCGCASFRASAVVGDLPDELVF